MVIKMSDMVRFLKKYLFKNKALFFTVTFFNLISVALSSIKMLLVYLVVDHVLKKEISSQLLVYIFVYLFLYLMKSLNDNYFSRVLQVKLTKTARTELIRSVCEGREAGEVDNGEILTLHDKYIPQIMSYAVDTINGFWGMCSVVVVNIVLYSYFSKYLVIPVIFICILLYLVKLFSGRSSSLESEIQSTKSKVNDYIEDTFKNMIVIKSYKLETDIENDFNAKYKLYVKSQEGMLKVQFWVEVINEFSYFMSTWLLPISALILVASGNADIALVPAIISSNQNICGAYSYASDMIFGYKKYIGILPKIEKAMEMKKRETLTCKQDLKKAEGIYFENVSMESLCGLKRIHLAAQKGKMTAIVGESGIGKTSLIRRGMQQGKIDDGEIYFNVWDEKNFRLAILNEDPYLFRGSILENIRLIEGVPKDEAHDLIQSFSHYYRVDFMENKDRDIGEGGQNLSAGQRKLLGFMMVLAAKPTFLILDEPTANLDAQTAQLMTAHLERLKNEMTVLVITHNGELIKKADLVYQIERNSLVL